MKRFFLVMILLSWSFELKAQYTIGSIPVPDSGYVRVTLNENAFGDWLRDLPLKPQGSPVYDYRGRTYKSKDDTTIAAVVDMDISGRRLEQCMDILIRLYAQYLWENNRAADLELPLPGGYRLRWEDWMNGIRPVFQGIKVTHKKTADADHSYHQYQSYLRTVYAESHTQQFYYQYERIMPGDLQIGDFFVLKGSKSHAVMVVDMAIGPAGETYALIGHGDTPACEFYLLNYNKSQKWIPLDPGESPLPLPIRRKMTWDGLRRFSSPKK